MRNIPGVFKICIPVIVSYILLLTTGCEKTAIQFGDQYIVNGVTNIVLVDSIAPAVSTIYKDSVITSQSGGILLGNYSDPYFGKTSANAYFQLAPPVLADLLLNAQYDSLTLLTKCNGEYYGDTSLPLTISVNQLSQEIKLAEGQYFFYNTTSFPVNSTPLGTRTFQLRPLSGDSANIKMNDALGLELYNMIKRKSDTLKDNALFTNYFAGLQVSSGSNNNIYGLKDSVVMRLYYHQTDLALQNKYFDFTFYNKSLQFNHITADRSGTPLAGLNTLNNELVSTASANTGYMQSATGIYVKISFPTLRKLLERSDFIKLIKADLIVKPVMSSYSGFYQLPPVLYGAQTDGGNEPGPAIISVNTGSSVTQTGNLFIDAIYGVNTTYSYDVTTYLQQQLLDGSINKNGILLIPPAETRYAAMNRVVIGDAQNAKNKLQLNVYYVSVKK